MKKIFIYITTIVLLIGCGGGDSSDYSGPSGETKMSKSSTYTLYPGNKIIKTSDNAQIKVTHTDGESISLVELVEGSATIIRNP